jgi:hypothetical protein
MGSPSIPAQPAPPDYAGANREAILTNIENLPIQRQIDAAARLGQSATYTDPRTGQQKTVDFSGMGDQAYAQQMAQLAGQTNQQVQRDQLALRQELGVQNAQQTAREIQAADPAAYQTRQDITKRVGAELNMGPATIGGSQDVARAAGAITERAQVAPEADGRVNSLVRAAGQRDPRLGDIYDQATRLPGEARDSSTSALNAGLQKAMADFQLGGKLNDYERRDVADTVRAGQVARGNYLGDAAAVAETMEMGKASDARAAQRLSNLLDIQGRAFGQNTQLRGETNQNALNRLDRMAGLQSQDFGQRSSQIGQMAGLIGQDFSQRQGAYQTGLNAAQAALGAGIAKAGDERAGRQEGFGYDQQRLSNANSVALGAPITNQFGSLGGAQQGAVGFNPVNFQGGKVTDANAGAQGANFAQGNFGTQAGMWGQQAQIASQGNPWMSLLGNVAGGAAGAATAMI